VKVELQKSPFVDFASEQLIRNTSLAEKSEFAEYIWRKALESLKLDEQLYLKSVRDFAEEIEYKHIGLTPKEYFIHPLRVSAMAGILAESDRLPVMTVGLLHNIYEISIPDEEEIISKYGDEINTMLRSLAIDRTRQGDSNYLSEYYESIRNFPKSIGMIKVIDKIDNLYSLNITASKAEGVNYLSEAKNYVVPLCDFLCPQISETLIDILQNLESIKDWKETI
jgi:(p)ppGpp synthase/HD superfamily hydrolase